MLKTLAGKHKTTVGKVIRSLRQGRDLVLKYEINGEKKHLRVFALRDLEKIPEEGWAIDLEPNVLPFTLYSTEIVKRLNANKCEYCGKETGYFEVHHVRKLNDVQGKEMWKQVMAAMRRKTIILCVECHHLLHMGTLPDGRYRSQ